MKIISKEKLIEILKSSNDNEFSINDLGAILQEYGEDWYIKDGVLQKD